MKSKITSFIMTIISILIVSILVLLGIIIYDEFANTDVAKDVQDFVTNVTVTGEKNQSVKVPDKIIETTVDALESSDEKINYDTQKIDKYYYNQLDEYSKKIYNAMNSNKENMKSGNYEINLGTQFSDLLSKSNGEELLGEYYQSAIEAYSYDNPDVFYIEFGNLYLNIETTTRGSKKTYKVVINAGNNTNYLTKEFSSEERVKSAINEIENVRAYFIQNKKDNTYDIYGHIYMDVTSIGDKLKNSDALKYTVVSGNTIISTGSMKGTSAGTSKLIATNIPLSTISTTYKVYLWFDENNINDYEVQGETIKATVRCTASMKQE